MNHDVPPHKYWLRTRGGSFRKSTFNDLFDPDATGVSLEVSVTLVPEPTNKFDPNAVMVQYEGAHLTYLPKELAAMVAAEVIEAGTMEIEAHILGGYTKHDGVQADFGVHLAAPDHWKHLMAEGAVLLQSQTEDGKSSHTPIDMEDLF